MSLLDELTARLTSLPADQRKAVEDDALKATAHMRWLPNPGPQTDAYLSRADVLFYGGAAGGGKSDLLLGLATTAHRRSLLMRRQFVNLGRLTSRIVEINGSRNGFNGSPPPRLTTADGRLVEFGYAQHLGDEQDWQGQDHDLLAFDEATHFLEMQVRFLMGWVRSPTPGQRTRVVLASNPPVSADGDWIIGMFRPWLDITHPNPAKAGELRWFVSDPDGKDFEVPGPEPYQFPGTTRALLPISRSFIPAKLSDNPFNDTREYRAQLDSMPEPFRTIARDGNFMATRSDAPFQVIPSAWVQEAVARWTTRPAEGAEMTAIAIDVAQGGGDETVVSSRYGLWFAPLIVEPGAATPKPSDSAALVAKHRRHNCVVIVDKGGGYGGGVIERLQEHGASELIIGFQGAGSPRGVTKDAAKTTFYNRRSEAWWRLREALDPNQLHGSQVALPNDPYLIADLTAPTFDPAVYEKQGKILVEPKEKLKTRLGRSPDRGDAVVMVWYEGTYQHERGVIAMRKFTSGGMSTQVRVGHAGSKRYGRGR